MPESWAHLLFCQLQGWGEAKPQPRARSGTASGTWTTGDCRGGPGTSIWTLGSREGLWGCGRPVRPEISPSEEPHGAATCHRAIVPLLWVPVEPATHLASDSHTLVSSGVWKKEGREKRSSTRPSPMRGGPGRGSPREAAYLGTVALGLVRGDDHVGHDEEGVFLLQSGRRGESTAMSPSAEPSGVAKAAGRSLNNRTGPLTSPTCHAENRLRN